MSFEMARQAFEITGGMITDVAFVHGFAMNNLTLQAPGSQTSRRFGFMTSWHDQHGILPHPLVATACPFHIFCKVERSTIVIQVRRRIWFFNGRSSISCLNGKNSCFYFGCSLSFDCRICSFRCFAGCDHCGCN